LKNSKSNFVPKFRGCGPGGINSSLMVKSISESRRSSNIDRDESVQSLNSYDVNNKKILVKME